MDNINTPLLKEIAKKQLEQATFISGLENSVSDLKTVTHRILFLLENDDTTGSKGLVQLVRENTAFRRDLKSKVTILGLVGGFISGIGLWIMNLITK